MSRAPVPVALVRPRLVRPRLVRPRLVRPAHVLVAAAVLAAVGLVGCDRVGLGPTASPTAARSATPGTSSGPVRLTLDAILADPVTFLGGRPVVVDGYLRTDGDAVELCGSLDRARPPACQDPRVEVSGEIPAEVAAALESATDATGLTVLWGRVELTGQVRIAELAVVPRLEILSIRVIEGGGD